MQPDWKPAARRVDHQAQPLDSTPVVSVRDAYGLCPLCETYGLLNRAHVVPKGQRGDDVPENLAWICGGRMGGAMGCHGCLTHRNRVIGHPLTPDEVARAFVRYCRVAVPQLGAYADGAKYAGWLEDYYLGDGEAVAA